MDLTKTFKNCAIRGYRLKDSDTVVSDIDIVRNTSVEDYEEVTIIISKEEIKQWNHEIEVLESESVNEEY